MTHLTHWLTAPSKRLKRWTEDVVIPAWHSARERHRFEQDVARVRATVLLAMA